MKIRLINLSEKLVLSLLLLTPIFSIGEVYLLISGGLSSQSVAVTPVYIKALKDILLVVIIMTFFMVLLVRRSVSSRFLILMSLMLFPLLFSVFSSLGNSYLMLLAGFRWFIFFILLVLCYEMYKDGFAQALISCVRWLFYIHIFAQLLEMFIGSHWYGANAFGMALRSPGIFLVPSSGAIFSIVCYLILSNTNLARHRYSDFFLVWFSVWATLSGTGLIILATLTFFQLLRLRLDFYSAVIALGFLGFFSLLFLDQILSFIGRGDDYLGVSGGTRLTIFLDGLMSVWLFSDKFGLATNTGVLLMNSLGGGGGMIADSMYASVLINLGWFGLASYILFCIGGLASALIKKDDMLFSCYLVFVLVSATSIVAELFPVNLLLAMLLAGVKIKGLKNEASSNY
jgi:hypothetical protein